LEEISVLIARATETRAAQAEKSRAFDEIVRRFQDLAFGCAYAMLGDFYLAEDAAQEAFITAWRNLGQLRQPAAFPGWFKRIVLSQCHRLTRRKCFSLVALEAVAETAADGSDLQAAYEARELQQQVMAAIQSLPEAERIVTTLFYISDYSQKEIAAFLEAPLTTVKKRLFSARQKLQERKLAMFKETLQARRPSRNDQFAETVALFNQALEAFIGKVKQDRYIIAAILFGSLSHDTVWRKSDIDIMLVGREEKGVKDFCLVENGVNIHVVFMPRSKFKQALEGALQGSMMHSSFALSTLLFTTDDTIRAYYQDGRTIGRHDRQMRLITAGSSALYTLAKAEKWLLTRRDVSYSFLWIMYTIENLARIEVLLHGQLTSREVIPQALKLNPAFFNEVYHELIHRQKDEAIIQQALDRINGYLDSKIDILFGPILDYLSQAGGVRTSSELDGYFRKQVQSGWGGLSMVYEWLADKGIIQKVPSPLRLTQKSQVVVDEAAYYYDGEADWPNGRSPDL
jgi:RNA polymerase sigma factor (sigma-70 family)